MGDLSAHFSRWEFSCKCGCGFDPVDHELILVLEDLHDHYDNKHSITVNSGNRCVTHNETVQKKYNKNYVPFSSKTTHKESKAGDIEVKGIPAENVADYLEKKYPNKYGIGRYKNRTHVDVRKLKARWGKNG